MRGEFSTLGDYFEVVRRRKWVIVGAALLVPLAAVLLSIRHEAIYEASADVLLSRQNLATTLIGVQDPSNLATAADRSAQTQADLARSPEVARRAIRAADSSLTVQEFLDASSVTPKPNADLLTFAVRDHVPKVAVNLTNAYVSSYKAYRRQVETAPIKSAMSTVRARLRNLDPPRGQLYNDLADKEQQLSTMETLLGQNATILEHPTDAPKVAPKPVRNGILALVLGLVLGLALAFLRDALDTRVRDTEEITDRVDLPLLARLPEPPRRLRTHDRLAMLADPRGVQAEAFRMLRTNLEFATLGKDVRTIMITSSIEQEGKSTTIANLAVALARAGQHVVLIDLDLRRPSIDRFFHLRDRPGVTQVALGHAELEHALAQIPLTHPEAIARDGDASNARTRTSQNGGQIHHGQLEVLPSGPTPPAPGEFLGTERLTQILVRLRDHADIVLVDAPPLFHVGDPMVLSAKVDGVIVVARMDVLNRGMVTELERMLQTIRCQKLGIVVTGAEADPSYGAYGYYGRPERQHAEAVT